MTASGNTPGPGAIPPDETATPLPPANTTPAEPTDQADGTAPGTGSPVAPAGSTGPAASPTGQADGPGADSSTDEADTGMSGAGVRDDSGQSGPDVTHDGKAAGPSPSPRGRTPAAQAGPGAGPRDGDGDGEGDGDGDGQAGGGADRAEQDDGSSAGPDVGARPPHGPGGYPPPPRDSGDGEGDGDEDEEGDGEGVLSGPDDGLYLSPGPGPDDGAWLIPGLGLDSGEGLFPGTDEEDEVWSFGPVDDPYAGEEDAQGPARFQDLLEDTRPRGPGAPVSIPSLDTLRFQDLVDDAKRLLPQLSPEWTNHNVADPGITLIEYCAQLTDQLSYRLDRITDETRDAYLALLAPPPLPATPARTVLTFTRAAGDPRESEITIPVGTTVPGPAHLAFTTLAPTTIPADSAYIHGWHVTGDLLQTALAVTSVTLDPVPTRPTNSHQYRYLFVRDPGPGKDIALHVDLHIPAGPGPRPTPLWEIAGPTGWIAVVPNPGGTLPEDLEGPGTITLTTPDTRRGYNLSVTLTPATAPSFTATGYLAIRVTLPTPHLWTVNALHPATATSAPVVTRQTLPGDQPVPFGLVEYGDLTTWNGQRNRHVPHPGAPWPKIALKMGDSLRLHAPLALRDGICTLTVAATDGDRQNPSIWVPDAQGNPLRCRILQDTSKFRVSGQITLEIPKRAAGPLLVTVAKACKIMSLTARFRPGGGPARAWTTKASGRPGQQIPLPDGALPGTVTLTHTEGTSPAVRSWSQVDTFATSTRNDLHFTVTPNGHHLCLGPATTNATGIREQHGYLPPQDSPLQLSCTVTAGPQGNLPAHAITGRHTVLVPRRLDHAPDAATLKDNEIWFFHGRYVVRYNLTVNRPAEPPHPYLRTWSRLPAYLIDDIDAAAPRTATTHYVYRGAYCLPIHNTDGNIVTEAAGNHLIRGLADAPAAFHHGIDAAFSGYPAPGSHTLILGDTTWTLGEKTAKPLNILFKDLPEHFRHSIDAAVTLPSGIVHLFRGERCATITKGTFTGEKSIAEQFPGLAGQVVHEEYSVSYTNPEPAAGGADAETFERAARQTALGRGPLRRVVTPGDYETALQPVPGLARAFCLPVPPLPDATDDLTILLVPRHAPTELPAPHTLRPTPALYQSARDLLSPLTPLGTRIALGQPHYHRLHLTLTLQPHNPLNPDSARRLHQDLTRRLHTFLHPATGGPRHTGWPLGHIPTAQELRPLLESHPHIDTIHDLDTHDLDTHDTPDTLSSLPHCHPLLFTLDLDAGTTSVRQSHHPGHTRTTHIRLTNQVPGLAWIPETISLVNCTPTPTPFGLPTPPPQLIPAGPRTDHPEALYTITDLPLPPTDGPPPHTHDDAEKPTAPPHTRDTEDDQPTVLPRTEDDGPTLLPAGEDFPAPGQASTLFTVTDPHLPMSGTTIYRLHGAPGGQTHAAALSWTNPPAGPNTYTLTTTQGTTATLNDNTPPSGTTTHTRSITPPTGSAHATAELTLKCVPLRTLTLTLHAPAKETWAPNDDTKKSKPNNGTWLIAPDKKIQEKPEAVQAAVTDYSKESTGKLHYKHPTAPSDYVALEWKIRPDGDTEYKVSPYCTSDKGKFLVLFGPVLVPCLDGGRDTTLTNKQLGVTGAHITIPVHFNYQPARLTTITFKNDTPHTLTRPATLPQHAGMVWLQEPAQKIAPGATAAVVVASTGNDYFGTVSYTLDNTNKRIDVRWDGKGTETIYTVTPSAPKIVTARGTLGGRGIMIIHNFNTTPKLTHNSKVSSLNLNVGALLPSVGFLITNKVSAKLTLTPSGPGRSNILIKNGDTAPKFAYTAKRLDEKIEGTLALTSTGGGMTVIAFKHSEEKGNEYTIETRCFDLTAGADVKIPSDTLRKTYTGTQLKETVTNRETTLSLSLAAAAPAKPAITSIKWFQEQAEQPTGLTARPGLDTIRIDWNTRPSHTYRVWLKTTQNRDIKTDTVSGPTHTFTGLEPNTRYTVHVVALVKSLTESKPATTPATTKPMTRLDKPQGLELISTHNTVTAKWRVDSDTLYTVEIGKATGHRVKFVKKVTKAPGPNFTFESLDPESEYEVTLTATRKNFINSIPVSQRKTTGKLGPDAPTGLKMVSHSTSSIKFRWDDAARAKRYIPWVRALTKTNWISASPITGTSHTFSGLPSGTQCELTVQSVDAGGVKSDDAKPFLVQWTKSKSPTPAPAKLKMWISKQTHAVCNWEHNGEHVRSLILGYFDPADRWHKIKEGDKNYKHQWHQVPASPLGTVLRYQVDAWGGDDYSISNIIKIINGPSGWELGDRLPDLPLGKPSLGGRMVRGGTDVVFEWGYSGKTPTEFHFHIWIDGTHRDTKKFGPGVRKSGSINVESYRPRRGVHDMWADFEVHVSDGSKWVKSGRLELRFSFPGGWRWNK